MAKSDRSPGAAFLTEQELFDALTTSAFEFLQRAIAEFSASTKFSTIHFATAIELFLKARLMREHWSLLLEKPDQADKAAFFKGEAKTVSPDQTMERLRRIAQVPIPQSTREIFDKIARHRNKMVHFAHAGEADAESAEGVQKIAEEQCAGWFALKSLLSEWPEFKDYQQKIWRIAGLMEGHQIYLQKAFEAQTDALRSHRAAGGRVIRCPSCRLEAATVKHAVGLVALVDCVVCYYSSGTEITITCPNKTCISPVRFTSFDGPPSCCESCRETILADDIMEALDTGPAVTKDNYYDHVATSCPQCSGYHTVVQHHETYVCTQCFVTDSEVGVCGYCSEGQLGGVAEHSYLVGCEFCEGSVGRHLD